MATLAEALTAGTNTLQHHACSVHSAPQEALELLAFACNLSREEIIGSPKAELPASHNAIYRSLLDRRLSHEPLAYLTGTAPFEGRLFSVGPGVLIPRDATSHIVRAAQDVAITMKEPFSFVDVGSGSGCIAISLGLRFPKIQVVGIDCAIDALRHAITNKSRLGAYNVTFRDGNLLDRLPVPGNAIIVANLPYLPTAAIAGLAPDITTHEPHSALDGGPDGMDLYRQLLWQLSRDTHWHALVAEFLPEQFDIFSVDVREILGRVPLMPIKNTNGIIVGAVVTRSE